MNNFTVHAEGMFVLERSAEWVRQNVDLSVPGHPFRGWYIEDRNGVRTVTDRRIVIAQGPMTPEDVLWLAGCNHTTASGQFHG